MEPKRRGGASNVPLPPSNVPEVATGKVWFQKKKQEKQTKRLKKKWVLRDFSGLTRCGNLIVLEVFQFNGSVLWANNILNDRSFAHQQNNLSLSCRLDIRFGIQDQ